MFFFFRLQKQEVEFLHFLRENFKFNSIEKLKEAIITDREKAINFLSRRKK